MSETVTEPEAEVTEPEPAETGDEPETPEPEPELEPEPDEPEPVAPPGQTVTPEQMEKFYKGLATRTATLNRWIEAELGDNYRDLSACPLCADGIVGHIYPPEWMEATTELQGRLLDVLRQPSAPDFQPAPNARRCGTCDGWGQVLSGSRVAGKERIVCPTCRGNGFQGGEVAPAAPNAGNGTVEFPPPPSEGPVATGDVDIWGSPRLLEDGQENPNYGKMVQHKNPELP